MPLRRCSGMQPISTSQELKPSKSVSSARFARAYAASTLSSAREKPTQLVAPASDRLHATPSDRPQSTSRCSKVSDLTIRQSATNACSAGVTSF
jgi:hypothetical protein